MSFIKNRNKVFAALTDLLTKINDALVLHQQAQFEVRQEYAVEYVEYITETFLGLDFVPYKDVPPGLRDNGRLITSGQRRKNCAA